MAKKVHAVQLKGEYSHSDKTIEEFDKKTEIYSYFSLDDILSEFDGKVVSITIREEDIVPSIEMSER